MNDEPPYDPNQPPDQQGTTRPVAGPTVHRSEVPPELQDIALEKFRAILKGNGVNPEAARITKFSGETLEFLSVNRLSLKSKIATKRQAGKLTGPIVIGGPQDVQTAIAKEMNKIVHAQDVIARIKDAVLERKDLGIGLRNTLIKTKFLHKDFVYYEPCAPCHGRGEIQCPRCHGKGSENCPRCHAAGAETCPACGGRQWIPGPNGQNQHCLRCNGSGKVPCSQCHQSKTVQCSLCKGKMSLRCQQCNGHKVISVLTLAEIDVEGTYSYDRDLLPENAVKKMDELGPAIVEHAKVEPLRLPEEQEGEVLTLPYHIKLPLADMEFTIQKGAIPGAEDEEMVIPVALFGYTALLITAPPFLETIMTPGFKDLEAATHKGANVKALLERAARYKTLRLIIIAAAKFPTKKAVTAVLQKTEIGLSETGAQKSVEMAQAAIKKIAGLPRLIGGAIGGILAAAMLYLYMIDLRAQILPHISSKPMQHIPDALALGLGLGLIWLAANLMATSAKKNGLKNILPKTR